MICQYCNREISEDALYCKYCGNKVIFVTKKRKYQKHDQQNRHLYLLLVVGLMIAAIYNMIHYASNQSTNLLEDHPEIVFQKYTSLEMQSNQVNGAHALIKDQDLFYINEVGDIYQTNQSLMESHLIKDGSYNSIFNYQNDLILLDDQYHISIYDLQNQKEKEIISTACYYVYLIDDQLYYQNDEDGESIYVYDLKSGTNEKLIDEHCYNVQIFNQSLYYSTREGIYEFDLTTHKNQLILAETVIEFVIQEDSIFYLDGKDDYIYCYDRISDQQEYILEDCASEFVVNEKYICYATYAENDFQICFYSLSDQKIYSYDNEGHSLMIEGDYLFFRDMNGAYCIIDLRNDSYLVLGEIETQEV